MGGSRCKFTLFIPLKRIKPRSKPVIRAQKPAKNDEPTIEKIAKNLSSKESKPNENDYDEKSLPLYRRILIKGKGVIGWIQTLILWILNSPDFEFLKCVGKINF